LADRHFLKELFFLGVIMKKLHVSFLFVLLSLFMLGCTQQTFAMDETPHNIKKAFDSRQCNQKAKMIREILENGDINLTDAKRRELIICVNNYRDESAGQGRLAFLDTILTQIVSCNDLVASTTGASGVSHDESDEDDDIVEEKKDKELDEEENSGPMLDSLSNQDVPLTFSSDDEGDDIDFEISYINEFDDGGKLMDAVRVLSLDKVRALTYFAAEDPVKNNRPDGASNHELFCYFYKAFNYIQKNYSWIKKILLPDGRVALDKEGNKYVQADFPEAIRSHQRSIYDCVAKAMLAMQRLCRKDGCNSYEHRWNQDCDEDEEEEDCDEEINITLNSSLDTTAHKTLEITEVSADLSRGTRSDDFEVSEVMKHLWYGNSIYDGCQMLSVNHNKFLLNKIILNGYNLLHNAVIDNEYNVFELLCNFKDDLNINKRSRRGNKYTALHLAVVHNRPKILDALLMHEDIEVNKPDVKGRTALHLAASKGRSCLLAPFLLDDDVNLSALASDGSDVITFVLDSTEGSNALRDRKMKMILERIKGITRLTHRVRNGGMGNCLLHCLVNSHYVESLECALRKRLIGPYRVNQMGDTPLMVAVKTYNLKAIEVLCGIKAIHYRDFQYKKAYQNYKKVLKYICKEYEWIKKRKDLGVGSYVSFLRAMKYGANITKEMINQEKIYDLVAGAISVVQKCRKS